MEVIVACTNKYGIGLNGRMAWSCAEELKIFKEKTMGSILIVGRRTAQGLPYLKGRKLICITTNVNRDTSQWKNVCELFGTVDDAYNYAKRTYCAKKIFIIGGAAIYNYVFENYAEEINRLHISFMKDQVICDKYLEFDTSQWLIRKTFDHLRFTHYEMTRCVTGEKQYLDLLYRVLYNGKLRKGRNGNTFSKFNEHLEFDLTKGFPLLTTKRMFFRGVVEELLFFLRGETDSLVLEEKRIKIWTGNTNREFLDATGKSDLRTGLMGPLYGFQWRHWNATYNQQTGKAIGEGVDQLKKMVELIRRDPHSRRILMTDYNPAQAEDGVLYPCHSIILQFYVDEGHLDMFCYNRSQDLFLGVPFNIASSALLLSLVASMTDLIPRMLHMSLGDAHIYESHQDVVSEQLSRFRYPFPELSFKKIDDVNDIDDLVYEDFKLIGYKHQPPIKAHMIA